MTRRPPPKGDVDPRRSATMRAVKSVDTRPEIAVRSLVHRMGFRFRLHRKDLPGTPDLVLPGRRKAIFVNGCFWHGHDCSRGARLPKSNADYWMAKVARNRDRDAAALRALAGAGWAVLTVWECELKDVPALQRRFEQFLAEAGSKSTAEPPRAPI